MGLVENAAALAGRTDTEQDTTPFQGAAELPDHADFEPGPEDAEQVPVWVAWNRLMRDVRAIAKGGKGGQFRSQGAGNYDFRGVDRTINAIGPAMRKHGLIIAPVKVEPQYRTNGKARECTVLVTWQVIGPKGDVMPGLWQSAGESLDYSDKGTAKAQSVALRVLLLTAAMVPTGDPDPDSVSIQRQEEAPRSAVSYRDEMVDPNTSPGRLQQIRYELVNLKLLGARVVNEVGDEETLEALGQRVYRERTGGAQ